MKFNWSRQLFLSQYQDKLKWYCNIFEVQKERQKREDLLRNKQGRNLRLIIYSYLTINKNLQTISQLSKTERSVLLSIKHHQTQLIKEQCIRIKIDQNSLEQIKGKGQFNYAIKLSQNINLLFLDVNFELVEKNFEQILNNLGLNKSLLNIYFEFQNCNNLGDKFKELTQLHQQKIVRIFAIEMNQTNFQGNLHLFLQVNLIGLIAGMKTFEEYRIIYKEIQQKNFLPLDQQNNFSSQKDFYQMSQTKSIFLSEFYILDPNCLFKVTYVEEAYFYDCVLNKLCYIPLQEWKNVRKLEFISIKQFPNIMSLAPEYLTYEFPTQVLRHYKNLNSLKISISSIQQIQLLKNDIEYLKQQIQLTIIATKSIKFQELIDFQQFSDNFNVIFICPVLDINYKDYQYIKNFKYQLKYNDRFIFVKQIKRISISKKLEKQYTLFRISSKFKEQVRIREQLFSMSKQKIIQQLKSKSQFQIKIMKYNEIEQHFNLNLE